MSLQDLANQVQSAGRGDDQVLVHMTPGEVQGLQALAMANGGSLTINPETGLPEAGFLSSLLPMAIGFGLAPFTGGMSAALITGAGYTAATGSLKKGIMAGLGAYGGAGLAGGLSSLGTQAAAPAVQGLSPTVAANTSALAGTTPLANVGAQSINTVDDIFLQAAKTPVAPTSQALAFKPLSATTPSMTSAAPVVTNASAYAPMTSNIGGYAQSIPKVVPGEISAQSVVPVDRFATKTLPQTDIVQSAKYFSPAERDLARRTAVDLTDPNAFVTTRVPENRMLLGQPTYKYDFQNITKLTPRAPVAYAQPDRLAQYSAVDFAKGAQYTPPSPTAPATVSPYREYMSRVGEGAKTAFSSPEGLKALYSATEAAAPYSTMAGLGSTALSYYDEKREKAAEAMRNAGKKSPGLIRPYAFDYGATGIAAQPYAGSAERTYFQPSYTALSPYAAPGPEYAAAGGLMGLAAGGGPVEQMSDMNAIGSNTGYPMADINTPAYTNPMVQRPEATNVIAPSADAGVGTYTGQMMMAGGGLSHLGDYSDGGRLLKGPGDGVSDSIPASIGDRQPARLADGEFVVPARIVSELGNGSTEAGARKLYAMMDRVQKARRKTVGKGQVAKDTKAEKLLPA